MDKNEIVETLNDLIETCLDGQEGFTSCAEGVEDSSLQAYMRNRAQSCASSATELQAVVMSMGEEAETSSSISGAMHRRWVDIKSMITGKDEESILNECERGEDVAVKSYQNALQKNLPMDVKALVQRQYEGVLKNHDEVKALRNRERASESN